ncbi:MAG: D-tagatose 3-epimerase [Planctomycetes bacterium RBG_16_64_12]|nr:MAG: D-tagatose 3-epimerase [Planctomycetes bacterium RBG_16_64_12]
MKFAICNETFQDWPFDEAFAFAAECGYTGIEMAPFTIANNVSDISPKKRDEVRKQADAAGLEIVGLHWLLAKTEGLYLTSPDDQVRRNTAEYLGRLARFCADLGGKVMVFGSPQQRSLLPDVSHEEAMQYAADVLWATVPTLEETEVMIALEPLAPRETTFMQRATDAVQLAEMVGSPQVRLHLDCKAMSSEATPIPELIHRNRDLLAHFHANDPNLQGPGFGDLDFLPILQALGEIDYGGWVSVEVFDYTPGVERLARQSIEHMLDCLAKLAG